MTINHPRVSVGPLLKEAREAFGYSQAELGRMTSISRNCIAMIENGTSKSPSFDSVMRLAYVLNVDARLWWRPSGNEAMSEKEYLKHMLNLEAVRLAEHALYQAVRGLTPK